MALKIDLPRTFYKTRVEISLNTVPRQADRIYGMDAIKAMEQALFLEFIGDLFPEREVASAVHQKILGDSLSVLLDELTPEPDTGALIPEKHSVEFKLQRKLVAVLKELDALGRQEEKAELKKGEPAIISFSPKKPEPESKAEENENHTANTGGEIRGERIVLHEKIQRGKTQRLQPDLEPFLPAAIRGKNLKILNDAEKIRALLSTLLFPILHEEQENFAPVETLISYMPQDLLKTLLEDLDPIQVKKFVKESLKSSGESEKRETIKKSPHSENPENNPNLDSSQKTKTKIFDIPASILQSIPEQSSLPAAKQSSSCQVIFSAAFITALQRVLQEREYKAFQRKKRIKREKQNPYPSRKTLISSAMSDGGETENSNLSFLCGWLNARNPA